MMPALLISGCEEKNSDADTGFAKMANINNVILASVDDISIAATGTYGSHADVVEVYAKLKKDVKVLNGPSDDASALGTLLTDENVTIISISDNNNYYKIIFKGRAAYIPIDAVEALSAQNLNILQRNGEVTTTTTTNTNTGTNNAGNNNTGNTNNSNTTSTNNTGTGSGTSNTTPTQGNGGQASSGGGTGYTPGDSGTSTDTGNTGGEVSGETPGGDTPIDGGNTGGEAGGETPGGDTPIDGGNTGEDVPPEQPIDPIPEEPVYTEPDNSAWI